MRSRDEIARKADVLRAVARMEPGCACMAWSGYTTIYCATCDEAAVLCRACDAFVSGRFQDGRWVQETYRNMAEFDERHRTCISVINGTDGGGVRVFLEALDWLDDAIRDAADDVEGELQFITAEGLSDLTKIAASRPLCMCFGEHRVLYCVECHAWRITCMACQKSDSPGDPDSFYGDHGGHYVLDNVRNRHTYWAFALLLVWLGGFDQASDVSLLFKLHHLYNQHPVAYPITHPESGHE